MTSSTTPMMVRMKSSLDFFCFPKFKLTAIAAGKQGNTGARLDARGHAWLRGAQQNASPKESIMRAPRSQSRLGALAVVALSAALLPAPAVAQDFYRGKTIELVIS